MLSPILACEDVDAAIAYYTEKLSFERGFAMPGEDGTTGFASVKLGDAEILLGVTKGFVAIEDRHKRGIGVQLYVEVPADQSIDMLYDHARGQGAIITRDLQDRDWGDRAFNVKDVDGYDLMFAQAKRAAQV
jgi:uncharacterized glyoxalase superfamily protein PhnB